MLAWIFSDVWRTGSLAMLGVIVVLSLMLGTARAQRDIARAEAASAQATAQATAAKWELHGLQLQADLHTCQGQWVDVRDRSAAEVAAAEAARKESEKRLADVQQRSRQRTPTCSGALLAAEQACPELEGY